MACRAGRGTWVLVGAMALWPLAASAQMKSRPVDVIAKPPAPTAPANKIEADYAYQHFNQDFSAWNGFTLEYTHRFDWGALLGRVNWADRYDETAYLYEIDAYPKLWKGAYLYLNVGYSPENTFFPQRRYGAEIFWSLPKQFEASAGARFLQYEADDIWLYTGSIGWYRGNWYMAVRPWISNKPGDTAVSGGFMARRYFATADDYCTLRVGGGETSEIDQSIDQLLLSNQWYVLGEWQRRLRPLWIFKANAGWQSQSFENGVDRQSWLVGVGVARLF